MRGGGLEIVAQRLAVGIHVDPDPAAPGVDLDLAQPRALVRQRALPVLLVQRRGCSRRPGRTRQPWKPQTKCALLAAGVLRAGGSVHQPAAAMRAHVVVGADLVGRRAHDQDRVVEDVVGEVVADLGDLLDAADLLPHLAPQLVALRPGVVLGNVGLHADRSPARTAPRPVRRAFRS